MNISRPQTQTILSALALLLVGLYVLAYNLKFESLSPRSDEIIHIRVVQEMVEHGNYFSPTYGGNPYFNKPPLKMWLSAPFLSLFGESNVTYRAVDVIAGLGLLSVVFFGASYFLHSPLTGLLAGLILLSCGELIFGAHGLRRGTQDGFLVFIIALSSVCLWNELRKNNFSFYKALLIGFLVGLGVLTKSVAGFFPLVLAGAYILSIHRFNYGFKPYIFLGVISLVAIALPLIYYLPHFLTDEKALRTALGIEVYERAVVGMHNRGKTWFYFNHIFQRGMVSSGILVTASLFYAAYKTLKKDSFAYFLLLWAMLPILIYSLANSFLPWYIFASFPAIALLVAIFAVDSLHFIRTQSAGRLSIYLRACACIVFGYFVYDTGQSLLSISSYLEKIPAQQLVLDKVVSTIKESKKDVIVFPDALNESPVPIARRHNLELIYTSSLTTQKKNVSSLEQGLSTLASPETGFVIVPLSLSETVLKNRTPTGYLTVKGFGSRKNPFIVFSYLERNVTPFRPWKEIILIGKQEFNQLFGFGSSVAIGEQKVRFATAERSAFTYTADPLLSNKDSEIVFSAGVLSPGKALELSVKLFINEFEVGVVKLKRNDFSTFTLPVPAQTFSPGENVISFLAIDANGKKFASSSRVVFYKFLSIALKNS